MKNGSLREPALGCSARHVRGCMIPLRSIPFRYPDGAVHVTNNHVSPSCFVISLRGDRSCHPLGTAASRGRRARCPRPPRYGRAECGSRDITTGDSCTGTNGGTGGGRRGCYSNQLGGPVLSTRDDESGLHNV